jgi:hypothetical protein
MQGKSSPVINPEVAKSSSPAMPTQLKEVSSPELEKDLFEESTTSKNETRFDVLWRAYESNEQTVSNKNVSMFNAVGRSMVAAVGSVFRSPTMSNAAGTPLIDYVRLIRKEDWLRPKTVRGVKTTAYQCFVNDIITTSFELEKSEYSYIENVTKKTNNFTRDEDKLDADIIKQVGDLETEKAESLRAREEQYDTSKKQIEAQKEQLRKQFNAKKQRSHNDADVQALQKQLDSGIAELEERIKRLTGVFRQDKQKTEQDYLTQINIQKDISKKALAKLQEDYNKEKSVLETNINKERDEAFSRIDRGMGLITVMIERIKKVPSNKDMYERVTKNLFNLLVCLAAIWPNEYKRRFYEWAGTLNQAMLLRIVPNKVASTLLIDLGEQDINANPALLSDSEKEMHRQKQEWVDSQYNGIKSMHSDWDDSGIIAPILPGDEENALETDPKNTSAPSSKAVQPALSQNPLSSSAVVLTPSQSSSVSQVVTTVSTQTPGQPLASSSTTTNSPQEQVVVVPVVTPTPTQSSPVAQLDTTVQSPTPAQPQVTSTSGSQVQDKAVPPVSTPASGQSKPSAEVIPLVASTIEAQPNASSSTTTITPATEQEKPIEAVAQQTATSSQSPSSSKSERPEGKSKKKRELSSRAAAWDAVHFLRSGAFTAILDNKVKIEDLGRPFSKSENLEGFDEGAPDKHAIGVLIQKLAAQSFSSLSNPKNGLYKVCSKLVDASNIHGTEFSLQSITDKIVQNRFAIGSAPSNHWQKFVEMQTKQAAEQGLSKAS